ncbi:MAG: hypothetical protein P4L26_08095 [Terracidiphilus sp.]|nr:hypothetical protein [Terracidiphilus sp.]
MRKLRQVLGLAILVTLLAAARAQQPRSGGARHDMDAAFHVGKTVVLVVIPNRRKPSDADESYGDWADGLNKFAAQAGAGIKILKVTPLCLSNLLLEPKLTNQFAILFFRDSEHALVYDGMVLEPKIYRLGLAYMRHETDEKLDSDYGLQDKPTRFR